MQQSKVHDLCHHKKYQINFLFIFLEYNGPIHGDDRLRRKRLIPNGEPRGTDLVKSVQKLRAKRTNLAALPLAA